MRTFFFITVTISVSMLLIYVFFYHAPNQSGFAETTETKNDENFIHEIQTKQLVDKLNEATKSIAILKDMLIDKNIEIDTLKGQLDKLKRKISDVEKNCQMEKEATDQTNLHTDSSESTIHSEASNTDLKIKSHAIIYRVQIISSGDRLSQDSQQFKDLNDVWEYQHEGLYKYTVGNEFDLTSASELQSELRKKGFSEAFVVAFKNGERIPVSEAARYN